MENILGISRSHDHFDGLRADRLTDGEAVEDLANKVRGAWNLGGDPISNMTAVLESVGVKFLEGDLPDRIVGLTCQAEITDATSSPVVLRSGEIGVEAKRAHLARDLAIRIFGETGPISSEKEQAVDGFAEAFLIPRGHLINEVGAKRGGMTNAELLHLKHLYGVPASMMLSRLGRLKILPRSAIDHAFRAFARSWRTKEPDPSNSGEGRGARERPQRFERLVRRGLGEREFHPLRASNMLGISIDDVRRGNRGLAGTWPKLYSRTPPH